MKDLRMTETALRYQSFTLDQPVTRQTIAYETGYSYTTICRKLRKLDYVKKRNSIPPRIYRRILHDLGFLG